MIDYSKILSRARLQRIQSDAEFGESIDCNTALALIDHLYTLDQALQHLTPMGSEYVNDPKRCVAYVQSTRESQHQKIIDLSHRLKAAEGRHL